MSPTSFLLNLLWIVFGGLGWAHLKLAGLALWPIGILA